MKLVTFEKNGPATGALIGDRVLDIGLAGYPGLASVDTILSKGLLPQIRNIVDNASELPREYFIPAREISLYPPVVSPGKIVCLGLNYEGHANEQGRDAPGHPILFSKATTSLTGPYDEIIVRPGVLDVDSEAELALVIGSEGTMIPEDRALGYVAGFMVFNDVSARKIQREDRQWFRGKSFDTFAPCGPCLVTPEEIGDHTGLSIIQRLNGRVMQSDTTSNMIFGVSEIISFISSGMTLKPGDIIATGTPAGVGLFRKPPVFLKHGDVVEIEIERIGTLRNNVKFVET